MHTVTNRFAMLTCVKCNKEKTVRQFYSGWDICMACMKGARKEPLKSACERTKEWQAANQDRFRCGQLVARAKIRARKAGIPFALIGSDIAIPTHCPVLGVKLSHSRADGWQTFPSLDRIVPELGYVKNNVIVVSMLANTIKNCATPDQIQAVANFYRGLHL